MLKVDTAKYILAPNQQRCLYSMDDLRLHVMPRRATDSCYLQEPGISSLNDKLQMPRHLR